MHKNANLKVYRMLINLSNHPYTQWNCRQKEAAAVYGKPIDLPFPSVSPEADESEIQQRADRYVGKVLDMGEASTITVHIMGEQTLCFAIIRRLELLEIPCIASCSFRDVEMQPDGSKLVNFHFTRFRKYI